MFPKLISVNSSNRFFVYGKQSRDCFMKNSFGEHGFYFSYFLFIQLCPAIFRTSSQFLRMFSGGVVVSHWSTPGIGSVIHVVLRGSRAKVFRVYARRVMARVKNQWAFFKCSSMKNKRKPVRPYGSVIDCKISISTRVFGRNPQPALVLSSLIHFRPKVFNCALGIVVDFFFRFWNSLRSVFNHINHGCNVRRFGSVVTSLTPL